LRKSGFLEGGVRKEEKSWTRLNWRGSEGGGSAGELAPYEKQNYLAIKSNSHF